MTNKRVVISGEKDPSKKTSGYVESTFKTFAVKFRTIFSKLFAQKF